MNNNIKFINKAKELEKRYKTRLTTPLTKNNVIEFHNSQLFKNNIKLRNRYNVLEKRIKFIKETINKINNEKKELQKALKNAETNLKNHNAALRFRKNIFNVPSSALETRREKARERRKTMTEEQKSRNKKHKHESYLRKKRRKELAKTN